MSDTMKALDEIEAALKPFASVLRNNGELYEPDWITRDDCKSAARALSLLPTLRAALTPPADDHPLSGITHAMWSEMVRTSDEPPADAAVNAVPELLALREEVGKLLDDLREVAKAITNGAQDTLWMGDGIADPTIVDFICGITGDDPSFIGAWERSAIRALGE